MKASKRKTCQPRNDITGLLDLLNPAYHVLNRNDIDSYSTTLVWFYRL